MKKIWFPFIMIALYIMISPRTFGEKLSQPFFGEYRHQQRIPCLTEEKRQEIKTMLLAGQVSHYYIIRPDQSVYYDWTHSSTEAYYECSWWCRYMTLPSGSPTGTWTSSGSVGNVKIEYSTNSGGWAGAIGFGYAGWIANSYQNCTNSLTAALQTSGIMLNYKADWTETGYIDRINSSDSRPETPGIMINYADHAKDVPVVQNPGDTVIEINYAQQVQEEDFDLYNKLEVPYIIIKKAGTGGGTIIANGLMCGKKCMELIIPYNKNVVEMLRVLPDADSYFVDWETPGGVPLADIRDALPGEVLIAVFDIK